MISSIVSRLVILVFGTLYPAYASYKAVRTKNVKEYVKWMMYWIVFALFTCAETFTDVFLSFWFPFYYEIKVILVFWLLSPATKGSSILYRKFVHPMLSRREQEIDEYIAKAKEQGYHTVLHLGTKGVNYATTVLMQTAIKGGGGLVNQLRRSYSLSDLSSDKESEMTRSKNVPDEDDMEETDGLDPRMLRPRGYSPRRSASGSGRVEMYFPEVDVDVRQHGTSRPREPSIPLSHIRSSEDVSSGYSSAEPLYAGHHTTKSEGLAASREPLVRTASVGSTRSMRTKSSRGGVVTKRGPAVEDSDFFELQSDEAVHINREDFFYANSLPSSPPSIPNNVPSAQEQFIDASEEDLPLFDAETDTQSNEFSLSESVTHDLSIENPSTKDLTISASVPHPFTLSSEASESLSNPKLTQRDADNDAQLTKSTNDVKHLAGSDASTEVVQLNSANSIQSAPPTHTASSLAKSSIEPSSEEKKSPTVLLQPLEPSLAETEVAAIKSPAEDTLSPDSTKHAENKSAIDSSLVEKVDQSLPKVQSVVAITPQSDNKEQEENKSAVDLLTEKDDVSSPKIQSVVAINSTPDNIEHKENKQTVDLLTEKDKQSLPDIQSVVAITPPSENTELKENKPAVDSVSSEKNDQSLSKITSVLATTPSAAQNSLNNDNLEGNVRTGGNIPLADGTGDESVSETQPAEITSPLSASSIEPLSPDTTECESLKINTNKSEAGQLNESDAANESSESLMLPETPSRSNSQTSLRKEGRAGRYHKHAAPTPPPRTPEPEEGQPVTPTLGKKDASEDVNEDTAMGSDDSDGAITTARLVLKPGVVRSLGPDPNTKAEVFVSKTPQTKNRKSKSKQKQGDSSISRLFAIPRNQFGSLTSLLPFWHGKQEPSSSNSEFGSPNHQSSEHLKAPLADYE